MGRAVMSFSSTSRFREGAPKFTKILTKDRVFSTWATRPTSVPAIMFCVELYVLVEIANAYIPTESNNLVLLVDEKRSSRQLETYYDLN